MQLRSAQKSQQQYNFSPIQTGRMQSPSSVTTTTDNKTSGVLRRPLRLNRQQSQRPGASIGSTTSQNIGRVIENEEKENIPLVNRSPLKELQASNRSPLPIVGDVNVMELRDGKLIDTPSKLSAAFPSSIAKRLGWATIPESYGNNFAADRYNTAAISPIQGASQASISMRVNNNNSSPFVHLRPVDDTPLPDRFPFNDYDYFDYGDGGAEDFHGPEQSTLNERHEFIATRSTPVRSRASRDQPSPQTERPFTRSMKRTLAAATSAAKQSIVAALSPERHTQSVVRSHAQLFGENRQQSAGGAYEEDSDNLFVDQQPEAGRNRVISWAARLATRFGFEWDFLVVAVLALGRLSMVPLRLGLSAIFRIWFWFTFRLPKRFQTLIILAIASVCGFSLIYWRWQQPLPSADVGETVLNINHLRHEFLSLLDERLAGIKNETSDSNATREQRSREINDLKEFVERKLRELPRPAARIIASESGENLVLDPQLVRHLEDLFSIKSQQPPLETAHTLIAVTPSVNLNETDFIQRLVRRMLDEHSPLEQLPRMIDAALDRFAADRLAKPDYALRSAGARIIRYGGLTSRPFIDRLKQNAHSQPQTGLSTRLIKFARNYLLGLITAVPPLQTQLPPFSQPADVVIDPVEQPGRCWSFSGKRGLLTVLLAAPINPKQVTIEHAPQSVWPDMSLAPKRMQLWGMLLPPAMRDRLMQTSRRAADDRDILQHIYDSFASSILNGKESTNASSYLLGRFEYQIDGSSLQTFSLEESVDREEILDAVQLRILDNYGHPDRTCVYRMRVHG